MIWMMMARECMHGCAVCNSLRRTAASDGDQQDEEGGLEVKQAREHVHREHFIMCYLYNNNLI